MAAIEQTTDVGVVSVSKAALLCGLSRTAIYNAIRSGDLRPVHQIDKTGVHQGELRHWYRNRKRGRNARLKN
jgi:predicted DNA-binding transcriptional regulator AlpA